MQRKILIGLVLSLIIVIFIAVYGATEPGRQQAALENQQAEAVERGARLYISNCASCHGTEEEGRIGPALKGSHLDEDILERIIAWGIPGTAMASWSEDGDGSLKSHQIRDLAAFIKNWDSSLLEELAAEHVTTPTATPTLAPDITPTTSATPMWTPVSSLEDIKYDPDTADSVLLSGKRIFQSSCSTCHALPTAQIIKEFSDDKSFIAFEIVMTEMAWLSLQDAERVIRYVLALRYDTAP